MVWVPEAGLEDGMDLDSYDVISEDELDLLEDQLFPHGREEADLDGALRGLVIVALHSALEAYAKSLQITRRRSPLPKDVGRYLAEADRPLDGDSFSMLVLLDESRHVIVHNRGVVDERYRDNTHYNRLLPGEKRTISWPEVEGFADLVWKVASEMHLVCERTRAQGGR